MLTMTQIRAVVLIGYNASLKLISTPLPEPGPRAVVAPVDPAGVCGTDMHPQPWPSADPATHRAQARAGWPRLAPRQSRHFEALPRLVAGFVLPRLITRYDLDDANCALLEISTGRVTKPALNLVER